VLCAASYLRRRWLLALAGGLLLAALAFPLVAFVVVPLFVRSTLVETPAAPASASALAGSPASTPNPVLFKGSLQRLSPVHFGTGMVLVTQAGDIRTLRFDGVEIAAAPNMVVYLSDRVDGRPGTVTDLGRLKATSGSFNYEIPAGVDLSRVKSVVVWCRAFTVTITFAILEPA